VPSAFAQVRSCPAVLIADNTHMGSQLLAEALRRERRFRLIGCADNADDLLFLLGRLPDVVVLAADFEKPGGGLQTAARMAAQECRASTIILLDEPCDADLVVQAFRAGARGVFSRSLSLQEMVKCIECVAAGQIWASGEQMDHLLAALKRAVVPRFPPDSSAGLLSRREHEVVRHLCDGLTNRDIARTLGLSEHTVKNHLFRIYAKLGVEKRVEVIFSLMSHAPGAELREGPSGSPAANKAQTVLGQSRMPEGSLVAQYRLDRVGQDGPADEDPFAAYTWLLRSERGATELLGKCRAIREMLGSRLTVAQRKQAETRAARPEFNRLRHRLHQEQPAPRPALSLPIPDRNS